MFTKFASYKVPPVMVSTHGSVVPLAMFARVGNASGANIFVSLRGEPKPHFIGAWQPYSIQFFYCFKVFVKPEFEYFQARANISRLYLGGRHPNPSGKAHVDPPL